MKGELAAFIDTSVLVYAVCADHPEKQRLARSIVERGFVEGCYATSTQVLVELYDVLTRLAEVKLPAMEAADYVRAFREWPLVEVDTDLVSAAVSLAEREEMSPWDAAVLEAARRADCTRVLSESLPAGRTYEGVRVENPFA
ncbi:MAG TPA: PIN domain-containing protein [Thermoanaerobaculia bacterium]|jgi:predicted nucleic acid-binding protein|nr:PIN domain-containing protein [Thermoanaerobaculia bacterium]